MEAVNPDSSEEVRNWTELPPEVMLLILAKLDIVEILRSAQIVCSSWRKLCKEPQIWRSIDMRNMRDYEKQVLEKIARLAVDRSCGQLVEFSVGRFGSEELLQYITDKSSPLRCLRLVFCDSISDEGLIKVARNLPLLEELQLCNCSFSKEAVEAVGRSCPLLKSFRLNYSGFNSHIECDEEAVSIAENMPELRHLHLYGNKLTNDGLQAILDGCPHLESLDLRHCFNVKLEGDLGRRCADRIRYLRPPNDTTDDYEYDDDYEFDAELYEDGSFDEEYQSGFSDFDFHLYDENYEYYEFSDGSDLSDPGDFGFGIFP